MEVYHLSVIIHYCSLGPQISEEHLNSEDRYVLVGRTKEGINQFRRLPKRCRCRKLLTMFTSSNACKFGEAHVVYKLENNEVVPDVSVIWADKKAKVPRIDMITKTDIEHAYVDKRKESAVMIEEVHLMQSLCRAELIRPSQDDPFEGRCLFLSSGYDSANDHRAPSKDMKGCYDARVTMWQLFHGVRVGEEKA